MLANTVFASLTLFLGLAAATPSFVAPDWAEVGSKLEAREGLRGCIGGAISCEYPKGRCAVICGDGSAPSSICECPPGQADNPWTGAQCIDIIRAAGRQGC